MSGVKLTEVEGDAGEEAALKEADEEAAGDELTVVLYKAYAEGRMSDT